MNALEKLLITLSQDLGQDSDIGTLQKHYDKLSARYRGGAKGSYTMSPVRSSHHGPLTAGEAQAYALARLPATYSALCSVLEQLRAVDPFLAPVSHLDLGAGPGTATFAMAQVFDTLKNATLVDESNVWQDMRRKILEEIPMTYTHQLAHLQSHKEAWAMHDCVTLSYVLSECEKSAHSSILRQAWDATEQVLVLVEPGTPQGFETIARARTLLHIWGAWIAAPCTHQSACPYVSGAKGWCHFKVRLDRLAAHRAIKHASLGYEDEPYSYLIVRRQKPAQLKGFGRIIAQPKKAGGHIGFMVCDNTGHHNRTLSRKHGERYQEARRLKWGDTLYN